MKRTLLYSFIFTLMISNAWTHLASAEENDEDQQQEQEQEQEPQVTTPSPAAASETTADDDDEDDTDVYRPDPNYSYENCFVKNPEAKKHTPASAILLAIKYATRGYGSTRDRKLIEWVNGHKITRCYRGVKDAMIDAGIPGAAALRSEDNLNEYACQAVTTVKTAFSCPDCHYNDKYYLDNPEKAPDGSVFIYTYAEGSQCGERLKVQPEDNRRKRGPGHIEIKYHECDKRGVPQKEARYVSHVISKLPINKKPNTKLRHLTAVVLMSGVMTPPEAQLSYSVPEIKAESIPHNNSAYDTYLDEIEPKIIKQVSDGSETSTTTKPENMNNEQVERETCQAWARELVYNMQGAEYWSSTHPGVKFGNEARSTVSLANFYANGKILMNKKIPLYCGIHNIIVDEKPLKFPELNYLEQRRSDAARPVTFMIEPYIPGFKANAIKASCEAKIIYNYISFGTIPSGKCPHQ